MGTTVSRDDAAVPSSRAKPPYLRIVGAFAGICAVLTTVVALVSGSVARAVPELTGPSWLDGWFQMDSGWYYLIVTQGYSYSPGQMSPIAFFPEYPAAVRAVGALLGDYQLAGTLVGVLCGLATVVLFAFWVSSRLPRPAAITAVAVMMLYPYALYLYGSMYADSLFILTAVVAFLLLERRHFWLAGLAGALATAGRPVGVAVAIGLVVRMLEMRAERRLSDQPVAAGSAESVGTTSDRATTRRIWRRGGDGPLRPNVRDLLIAIPAVRWREAGVLISVLGLAGWCLYLWLSFGDPIAFLTVQEAPGWNQPSGPATWLKVGFFRAMVLGPVDVSLRLFPQALMCLLAVLLLPRVKRLFGWGYLAFSVVVLAIPIIGTKDFMGTGRYVLAAFPVMAAAGDYLAARSSTWVRPVVLVVLGLGLVGATVVYASGVEVS